MRRQLVATVLSLLAVPALAIEAEGTVAIARAYDSTFDHQGLTMTLNHLTRAAALLGMLGMLAAGAAHADESVGARHITRIGCHHVNGVCYVTLDGPAFGATEKCAAAPSGSNQFRFDNADTVDGRRTYASMLAAFLSQRPVSVMISGCSVQGVPSLLYYDIAQ